MKKKSILWAALSMIASLMMTACSSDDNTNESPSPQNAAKTIPYSVTVSNRATTRATVESDNETLYFAADDKLYVTGTNIKGVLDIQTGTGTASATFSGDLTYSGEGSPANDLSLTATLVSAQQSDGNEITVNTSTGAVTINYPTTAYCADVATAVKKYSNLTGTSTYGAKSFSLSQQTAFLNFAITLEDGTASGTELSAVVSNNSEAVCTANVTTATESEKVVAKFVLPVAKGITLSSADVKMGTKDVISFGASQTLEGKVYNVKKTLEAPGIALTISNPVVGQVIGSDGKNYDFASLPSGVTAIARICYVWQWLGQDYGLAMALYDEVYDEDSIFSCAAAQKVVAAHKPAISSGGEWKVPSRGELDNMRVGVGDIDSFRTYFSSVGGENMLEWTYWVDDMSEDNEYAYQYSFYSRRLIRQYDLSDLCLVRACLYFY